MFLSLAVIFIFGLLAGKLCEKLRLPSLLGMLAVGIILGPFGLNLIDPLILNMSAQLRKIALIVILLQAGLSLDISTLKKNGRPAALMCFVPACFEILGTVIFAPRLLGLTLSEAAITGAVIAAVSPAVVVPKMLELTKSGYGTKQGIPQLIMAGASVDDVFVIVMFSAFVGLEQTGKFSAAAFAKIPVSICSGIAAGLFLGFLLGKLFRRIHIESTVKIIILMSFSFLFVAFEDAFQNAALFSALIAVMCIGVSLHKVSPQNAKKLSEGFGKLWVVSKILLFVLVGACVNISYAAKCGSSAVFLIFAALVFRMLGVLVCVTKTKLSFKERAFCMLAYMPKATVQAAIGGVPLAMGLNCGETVLTIAAISIIITAPLGAFLIDLTHSRLLKKAES